MSVQPAELDLYGGIAAIRDRMMVTMRDLVAQGFDPAVVVVGLLTGAGVACGMLTCERAGPAWDEDLSTDLAVIVRSAAELTASVMGSVGRDPGDDIMAHPEAKRLAANLTASQHVVACDLRDAFGGQYEAVHPLASIETVGSA